MNGDLRILRVAQKVYPDSVGGGPYHVHAMSRDQAAMGHDVTVLTVGDAPCQTRRDGYTIVRSPSLCSVLGNDVSPGVWQHLRDVEEYDVVHAHSHLYFSTNLAAFRRRRTATPLALTNHGLYSQTAPKWVFDAYLRTVGRWTFNSADSILCYTREDQNRLRRLGVTAPVEVIQNGVDTDRFTPVGPYSTDVTETEPVVLFVGRLVDGKRPQDALEAFALFRELNQKGQLYFCGDGPLRASLDQQAHRLDIDDAVTFLGHVPYEKMPAIYRSANVLVLPSRAEGLPRTVLEALASGVPVVVSDLEQVETVVSSGGETVPVGDVSQFATAIERIISETESYDPREVIDERYSWADTVRRTTAVLEALAA